MYTDTLIQNDSVIPPNPKKDEQTDVLKKYIVQFIDLYVISGRTISGINKSVGKCCGWCGSSSLASLSLRRCVKGKSSELCCRWKACDC